jgi:hypothetical protein
MIMVLVIALAIPKNRVTKDPDTELGSTFTSFGDERRVTVDERREEPGFATLLSRGLLFQIRDLQVGIGAE